MFDLDYPVKPDNDSRGIELRIMTKEGRVPVDDREDRPPHNDRGTLEGAERA